MSQSKSSIPSLMLGALGVVYGDIGTSPLYALKECFMGHHPIAPTHDNVLGLLSLMFWSLTMVVSVKYLAFVMRASHRGEGGILALLALCPENFRRSKPGKITVITAFVVFGAALLYGDGVITPAISVLSAIEGLEVAKPSLHSLVIPITCTVLVILFAFQRYGTHHVGRLFGPVMLIWFFTLSGLGLFHIAKYPAVLSAISPHHAVNFMVEHGFRGFAVLGAVILCVTGGEALYADMGHFGVSPIRRTWFILVMPALVLAYFGQGALVLQNPVTSENPFYAMVPEGNATYVLVGLSTMATVIASQALISGAYSLTHQAVQLGLFPRVRIRHTSHDTEGQIYIPEVNWALAFGCILLVLIFRHSSALAAAYGIAVCGTMAITSCVFFVVMRYTWKWSLVKAGSLLILFLFFDLGFLGANLLKFKEGGYVPVLMGFVIFALMVIWHRGRSLLGEQLAQRSLKWDDFFKRFMQDDQLTRTPGIGVFMASNSLGAPPMLVHHAERIKALPEKVILLTIHFDHVPMIPVSERIEAVKEMGDGFHQVIAKYGYMQEPDAPIVLIMAAAQLGLDIQPERVTYYLGRETFLATSAGKMNALPEMVFRTLARNAYPASAYFRVPNEQVVELGLQIDL